MGTHYAQLTPEICAAQHRTTTHTTGRFCQLRFRSLRRRHRYLPASCARWASEYNKGMTSPAARLLTLVDFDGHVTRGGFSVSARHELELITGGRIRLLGDRGWSSSGLGNIGESMTIQEIEDTARVVVGPDEPFDGYSHEDMETDHWNELQRTASRQGVSVSAAELKRLPHDVELSPRLRSRLRG